MDKKDIAIKRIKNIVDAYMEKRINISIDNQDFDCNSHTYDVSAIMGIIAQYVKEGLSEK